MTKSDFATDMGRRAFCRSMAGGLAISSLAPRLAFADVLPAQDEFAVLRKLGSLMEGVWPRGTFPNADGSTEANKSGYIQIGFQYHTFTLVPNAVLLESTRSLDALLRIAEYTFQHQHPDGRFDYSESNGTVTTGSPMGPLGEASNATLFFYDFGHTLVLLPKSSWFASSAVCAPYRARLAALRDKCGPSLNWLLSQRQVLATDHAASNRTLAHGMSYYFLGRALGRPDALQAGRDILRSVVDAQTPDGVFIEGRGFDSSYQMANVLLCAWTYLNLDPSDGSLREGFWNAIKRGVSRELPSIASTGEVATAGNSRVAANGESFEGHKKTVNSKQVMAGLGYYAVMAGDDSALETTRRVYQFYYPKDKVDF
jgi:hypothetical protein